MSEFSYGTDYEWRNNDEDIERKQRAEMLDRMRELAEGEDSSLPRTRGIIQNYNLKRLSSLNKTQTGLVRSARFLNGSFLSFRMEHANSSLQTDFVFKRDERPSVTTWRLRREVTGLERATTAMGRSEDYFLRTSLTGLVRKALAIIEEEAAGETPWAHSYSPIEISATRFASGTMRETRHVKPEQIKISPVNGEPYL